MVEPPGTLFDRFGRLHTNLRISVTDRCNIRCFYCMPATGVVFQPRSELLSFEEITRVVAVAIRLGIRKIRITGGEPLVRQELSQLIGMLSELEGLDDLALTTNGILLDEQAESLRAAGLQRLNISLDTLREETFQRITRRRGVDRVLAGIEAAIQAGFPNIRLNALAIAGLTEQEIVPLVRFAIDRDLELRFIEFMPLDAEAQWQADQVLTGEKVKALIESQFGPLVPSQRDDPSQPAVDYNFSEGSGRIGLINPVSQPFCQACDRVRLTAEGKIRNCLFSTEEWDVRQLLRGGGDDDAIADQFRKAVDQKKAGHGIDDRDFVRPERAMYQIGG